MRALCFATGNLRQLIGKTDIFKIISSLDVDGIELTLGKDFNERKLQESDESVFKNYKHNSIHSPFRFSLKYCSIEEMFQGLEILKDYSKRINSTHIIAHPVQIFPEDFDKNSSLNFLTENLNPKKGKDRPRLGYEVALKNNPGLGLCLDVSHAYDWSINETDYVVSNWKHRIKQVHFSNNRYHKDHLVFEKVSRSFLKSIEPLRELNVPIVIEEDMPYSKVNDIKDELKRVKNVLGF